MRQPVGLPGIEALHQSALAAEGAETHSAAQILAASSEKQYWLTRLEKSGCAQTSLDVLEKAADGMRVRWQEIIPEPRFVNEFQRRRSGLNTVRPPLDLVAVNILSADDSSRT